MKCTLTYYELRIENHITLRMANKIIKTDTFNSMCKTCNCTKINFVWQWVPYGYDTFSEKIMFNKISSVTSSNLSQNWKNAKKSQASIIGQYPIFDALSLCHGYMHTETCLKLFQNYFTGLLQLTNIFQHVHCRWNDFEIILELLRQLKQFYFSFKRGYVWNKTLE